MADEGTEEQVSKETKRTVADFLPETSWVDEMITVEVVESLPDDAAGDYDWETKQLRISASKVERWADDVFQAKRKATVDRFREKVDQKWASWDDETRRSAIMTYLYLRVLNHSFDSHETLKRNFETEIVAHEARHAYDDSKGYKEQIGQVGPVEALALLAQLEHSPVYERTFFTLCIEPYWLQQAEGYKPASLHEQVGVVVMRTMTGFAEADNPQLVEQPLANKMKHIAFLSSEKFKELCGEVKGELEKQIYTPGSQGQRSE